MCINLALWRATNLASLPSELPVRRKTYRIVFHPLRNECLDPLSPREVDFVLGNARMLRKAGGEFAHRLLRGKNLGLLCESADGVDATRFRRAAVELGARVAHIRPDFSEASAPEVLQQTARMLGRLYDAIECQGLPSSLVQKIEQEAGVPVFDGVACANHATARLATMLGSEVSPDEGRQAVLQAVLVGLIP
ncbi:MAG: ornithine carbamoyltransferase [Caldimonas sp.]